MAVKLTPNMIKSLTNLAKAGSVIATNGTLAMNAKGCTAPAMDALKRRGMVEMFETDQPRNAYEGDTENHRAYRVTDAGREELGWIIPPAAESVAKETTPAPTGVDLNTGWGVTQVQTTRNLLVNALVAGGMDHRAALDAVHNAQDAAWEAGYDDGFRAGKGFYKN